MYKSLADAIRDGTMRSAWDGYNDFNDREDPSIYKPEVLERQKMEREEREERKRLVRLAEEEERRMIAARAEAREIRKMEELAQSVAEIQVADEMSGLAELPSF